MVEVVSEKPAFRPEPSIKPQVFLMMALMRMTRPLQKWTGALQ